MKVGQNKRQGDVSLMKVSNIPASAKLKNPKERMSSIIARGENSNHSHVAVGKEVEVYEDTDGTLYVNAKGEFELKHILESNWLAGQEVWTQEHTPHTFPAGTYKFLPQYEYHPYTDEIQRVKD
jgi:hypothetical protein